MGCQSLSLRRHTCFPTPCLVQSQRSNTSLQPCSRAAVIHRSRKLLSRILWKSQSLLFANGPGNAAGLESRSNATGSILSRQEEVLAFQVPVQHMLVLRSAAALAQLDSTEFLCCQRSSVSCKYLSASAASVSHLLRPGTCPRA